MMSGDNGFFNDNSNNNSGSDFLERTPEEIAQKELISEQLFNLLTENTFASLAESVDLERNDSLTLEQEINEIVDVVNALQASYIIPFYANLAHSDEQSRTQLNFVVELNNQYGDQLSSDLNLESISNELQRLGFGINSPSNTAG